MHTQMSNFGVTESHYTCILFNLVFFATTNKITVCLGPEIWHISIAGYHIYSIIISLGIPVTILLSGGVFDTIFKGVDGAKKKIEIVKEWATIIILLSVCNKLIN